MNKAHKSLIWMVVATSVMWTACGKDDSNRRTQKPKGGTPEQLKVDKSEGAPETSLQGVWLRSYEKSNDIEKYVVWNIKLAGEKNDKVQLTTMLTCKKGTAKTTAKEEVSSKIDASRLSLSFMQPIKMTASSNKDFKGECSATENPEKYTYKAGHELMGLEKNRRLQSELCKLEKKGDKWKPVSSNCKFSVTELELEIESALTTGDTSTTTTTDADKAAAEKAEKDKKAAAEKAAAEKAAAEKAEKDKKAAAEKAAADKTAADKSAAEKAEKDKKAAEEKKRQEEEDRKKALQRATQNQAGKPGQNAPAAPGAPAAAPAPQAAASAPAAGQAAPGKMNEELIGLELVLEAGKLQKESGKVQFSMGLILGEDSLTYIKACQVSTDKGMTYPKTEVTVSAKITDTTIEILEAKPGGTDCKLEVAKSKMSYKFDGTKLAISSFDKDKNVVVQTFTVTDGQ